MALEGLALAVGVTLLALLIARTRQPRRGRTAAPSDGSDAGDGSWFDATPGDVGGCDAGSDGGSDGGCGDGGGGGGGGD